MRSPYFSWNGPNCMRLGADAEHLVAHDDEVGVLLHERREDVQHRVGVVLGCHGRAPPQAKTWSSALSGVGRGLSSANWRASAIRSRTRASSSVSSSWLMSPAASSSPRVAQHRVVLAVPLLVLAGDARVVPGHRDVGLAGRQRRPERLRARVARGGHVDEERALAPRGCARRRCDGDVEHRLHVAAVDRLDRDAERARDVGQVVDRRDRGGEAAAGRAERALAVVLADEQDRQRPTAPRG